MKLGAENIFRNGIIIPKNSEKTTPYRILSNGIVEKGN